MIGKIKNYVQSYVQLAKLESIEAVSKIAAKIVYIMVMILFALFFLLLLSFAVGFYLSAVLDSRTYGFLIITGFYLLMIILFVIFKKSFINGIINMAIAASTSGKKDIEA